MITTANQVYDLTRRVIREARAAGSDDIAQELDDAMRFGGTGLEILGTIKTVILAHGNAIEKFLTPAEIEEIVRFVNRAFGSE